LPDLFEELGLTPASESKHKARVVYATVTGFNRDTADLWRREGQEQPILDGSIISRPGLHGWNKIDDGSALLARHLPELHGHIADFGCGWGYLSLQAAGHAKRLTLIDVDARAIDLAERNVKKKFPSLGISTIWADLTRPEKLGPFDAILLNPPFHDGTKAAPEIGQAIIRTAARSLAPAGSLYLVANKHLPYENTLRDAFKHVELLAEENGFKTLVCR
jgi:16S rRNA (guanine1207-N2)-methyltransferase